MTAPGKRILVVEDNDVSREGLAVVLRQQGYEAVLAANGHEALDLLHAGPRPDLIILDMLMPVLDGWHFLQRWRRQEPQLPIPILVCTGSILTREWANDHHCQGFLRKPIETELPLEEVQRCLA
jgi:CheY-like chemotaxis protein